VHFQPDDQRMMDIAPSDLFLATDADRLVWKPILDWIVDHRGGERFVLTDRESPAVVVGGYTCPDAMSEHSTL